MSPYDERDKIRIRWHCRRGMYELDLMLIHFFDKAFKTLSTEMQQIFVKLLDEADQDLQRWLTGQTTPDNEVFLPIIDLIRQEKMIAVDNIR